jgi:hypothetical protein
VAVVGKNFAIFERRRVRLSRFVILLSGRLYICGLLRQMQNRLRAETQVVLEGRPIAGIAWFG